MSNASAAAKRRPDAASTQIMFVKGVDYSPAPNQAIWERDLPMLRRLGANAVKVYNANVTINDSLQPFLDAAYNNGRRLIYTIPVDLLRARTSP